MTNERASANNEARLVNEAWPVNHIEMRFELLMNSDAEGHAPDGDADTDPFLAAFSRWKSARLHWNRLSVLPGNERWDSPESVLAEQREYAALKEMIEQMPTSKAGMLALVEVLWDELGPTWKDTVEEFEAECVKPENALLALLWRALGGNGARPTRYCV